MMTRNIFLAFLCSTLVVTHVAIADTDLSPAYQALVTPEPLSENYLENNLYPAIIGIEYPYDNFIEIGRDVIQKNYKELQNFLKGPQPITYLQLSEFSFSVQQLLKNPKLLLNIDIDVKKNYRYDKFPCTQRRWDQNCVVIAPNEYKILNELIDKNKAPLVRYQSVKELEEPLNTVNSTAISIDPSYIFLTRASYIDTSRAILEIQKGNIQEGLKILQSEIEFSKKILNGTSDLYLFSVQMNTLSRIYKIINDLMDSPNFPFEQHQSIIQDILTPLSLNEQNSLYRSMHYQINMARIEAYLYINNRIKDMPTVNNTKSQNEKNLKLNAIYKHSEEILQSIKSFPFDAQKLHNIDDQHTFISNSLIKYDDNVSAIFADTLNLNKLILFKFLLKTNQLPDIQENITLPFIEQHLNLILHPTIEWNSEKKNLSIPYLGKYKNNTDDRISIHLTY